MKKHGIDKDIASVKDLRKILESNSPLSISPQLILPNVQQDAIDGGNVSRDKAARWNETSKEHTL